MGGGVTVTFMSGSDPSIVKTTCPDPLTAPLAKDDPSFVALNRFPAVFPPIVHVIVCVVSLEVCVHAYEDPVDHPLKREMVTRAVPSLFVTVRFETFTDPSAIVPFTVNALKTMPWPVFVRIAPLFTVSVAAVNVDDIEVVPAIVTRLNAWTGAREIVLDVPAKVIVEVPAVNMEPTPELSQLPSTVQLPLVTMITPELPPVTVTLDTITGEPEAIRMPALPIVREPPASPRLAVTRVVVPLPPWTRRVPDQTRAFAAIVYVTVDAPPSNVTSTNSALPDGRAANIMLRADDELNVIGAEKLQDADEDAFVHEPETIHEPPLADPMTPEAFATVTLPVMETFEACVRRVALAPPSVSPPPIVRA